MANIESDEYYEILGVAKNASKDEINKAYKKLALKYQKKPVRGIRWVTLWPLRKIKI